MTNMRSPSTTDESHQWNGNSTPITIPQLRGPEVRVDMKKTMTSLELKENINDNALNKPIFSSSPHQPLYVLQPSQLTAVRSSSNRLLPRPATHLRESNSPITGSAPSFLSSHQLCKRNTPPNRGKWTGASILRPGESMESFFGIDQASTEEYRQLCRSIANGVEDSAKAWHRVLELASERAAKDRAWFSNGKKSTMRSTSKSSLSSLSPLPQERI